MLTLSGGTPTYYVWVNNTAPGCTPMSLPITLAGTQDQFTCTPTSAGSYNVHIDVVDSTSPAMKASQSTTLIVNPSSGGGGNGSGKNGGSSGNGSFSLPSNLIEYALIFGLIFVGAMVALAAGMIATAVLVGRRLRQLNETIAKYSQPPKDPKSPT